MKHECQDAMIFELESGDFYCLNCGETFADDENVDENPSPSNGD